MRVWRGFLAASGAVALLAAAALTAGCGREAMPGVFIPEPWPTLPAALTVPVNPPPDLPAHGSVGRGTLVYAAAGVGQLLAVEGGRDYRLPAPPPGEGRQGTMTASLSPGGRWLGLRAARYPGDRLYRIRDLTGDRVVEVTGTPRSWSADGRYLLLAGDRDFLVVEPGAGITQMVTVDSAVAHLVRSVMPNGGLLIDSSGSTALKVTFAGPSSGGFFLELAADPDDECWCPDVPMTVSPDGQRLTRQLVWRNGLVPGTDHEKSRPRPGPPSAVVPITFGYGSLGIRQELAAGEQESWRLLADTGTGLLLLHRSQNETVLVLMDQTSGRQRVVTRLDPGISVLAPGTADPGPDG